MAMITINGVSLDPMEQSDALAATGLETLDAQDSNYILVQTTHPLTMAELGELGSAGAEVLEYAPENTYICRYAPADLERVRALPFVVWANVYLEEFKIAPALRAAPAPLAGNLMMLPPVEASMAQEPVWVEVVLHKYVDPERAREGVARAAKLDPDELEITPRKIRLRVPPQQLEELAALDEVRHIEPFAEPKLFGQVALGILRADQVHGGAALQGTGEVVAVCDTGFDLGTTTNVHPAFAGRVTRLYALGRAKSDDPNGHGTHVAGSVLGDGTSAPMGGAIRGSAPGATLVLQSVLDAQGGLRGLPLDLNDLFRVPYQDDSARVHTNSWGSATAGRYTQSCQEVDEFVWQNRDCVICFAAGNEGVDRDANGAIDAGNVGSPGAAKNCITIGASESMRVAMSRRYGQGWPTKYPSGPIASDLWADNPDGMAAFSSRGPTRDGRIKPDVVAPGTSILSAHSRAAKVGSTWGSSLDPLFCFMGGTSMATPLVAGCAAVVREFLRSQHAHQRPSAALVKAMLINGARDIVGQYVPSEAASIPNIAEGFGRVDLAETIDQRVVFFDEAVELETGQREIRTVQVAGPNRSLKATLVWTDPAGEALQNDLDLIVRAANGEERHGNLPAGSVEFDRTNNVEQVIWTDPPQGDTEIIVHAHRAAPLLQSYALVIRLV